MYNMQMYTILLHVKPDQSHLGWVCFSFTGRFKQGERISKHWHLKLQALVPLEASQGPTGGKPGPDEGQLGAIQEPARGQPIAQNRTTYKNDSPHCLKSDQQEHPLLGPEQESKLHHLLSVRFQRRYWSSLFVWFQIIDYKQHHTKHALALAITSLGTTGGQPGTHWRPARARWRAARGHPGAS